ncbi:hypothetical protein BpHYR1_047368, partial [Brachionus plicatilis]
MILLILFAQLLLPICSENSAYPECNDVCKSKWSKNCFCDHCDLFDDCCQDKSKSVEPSLYECNSKLSDHHFIYT